MAPGKPHAGGWGDGRGIGLPLGDVVSERLILDFDVDLKTWYLF